MSARIPLARTQSYGHSEGRPRNIEDTRKENMDFGKEWAVSITE